MNGTTKWLTAGAVIAVAVTACGASANTTSTHRPASTAAAGNAAAGNVNGYGAGAATTPSATAPAAASTPAVVAPAPASQPVVVARSTAAGMVLAAAANGRSLYTFLSDVAGSGQSACNAGCIGEWPPLTVSPGSTPVAGPGVAGQLGTIRRADGRTQVTFNGLPLYFFAGDTAAGQLRGDYPGWKHVAA